jgi:hypothetical protein
MVTTSEKPDTKARPGDDMSVKREVSLSTAVKKKSRVWESNKPVKKMASKFVVKKASQAKQGKELSGSEEGEEKIVRKKSRMVSELSSRWEGISTPREDLPEPGGYHGQGGPVEGGGEGPVSASLPPKEHYDKITLKTEEIRVKHQDTDTFIMNINKYKCTETIISMKEPGPG